jgi:hypothetical protein
MEVAFEVERIAVDKLNKPRTAIMVNLGNPESAFKTAMAPNMGGFSPGWTHHQPAYRRAPDGAG